MTCLNCDADNTRDFPVCETCAPSCHFTNRADCRCAECVDARDLAAMPASLRERLRGSVLLATSDDPVELVRVPFSVAALKPERRLPVARALSDLLRSVARAA